MRNVEAAFRRPGTTVAAIVIGLASLSAQRPASATYDHERFIRLEGSITRIDWVNPRAFLFIDVRDASGTVANWAIDIGNPIELERQQWTRSAVRIGDVVAVQASPARGPARQALARSIMLASSRKALFTGSDFAAGRPRRPAPR